MFGQTPIRARPAADAASAEDALELLKRQPVDVIFMDHTMPGMDGLEAVSAIKKNPRTAMIPVMMYTAKEGEVYVGQARALGAIGVLPKQVRPAELFEVLLNLGLVTDRRGKKRGPAERAAMVRRLGLRRVAYDWRNHHVPTFEQEILEYRKQGIEYFAFWGAHDDAFRLFEKYGLRPQIWQTLKDAPGKDQDERVRAAAQAMLPLVERTRKLGCKLGLFRILGGQNTK